MRDGIKTIICEWQSDCIVQYSDGTWELISVKHLESSQSRWTVKQLVDKGGLKKLCERWVAAGKAGRCALETNAGMRRGVNQPGGLVDALANLDIAALTVWASKLAPFLSVDEATALGFLECLQINAGLPNRDDIRSVNLENHVRPVAAQLNISSAEVEGFYDRIVAIVEEASRDAGREDSVVAMLANPSRLQADEQLLATVARRTVDRDRLIKAVRPPGHPIALTLASAASGETALVKKLRAGGVGPTAIRNAQNLRSSWLRYQGNWSTDLPGDVQVFDDLAVRIIAIAEQAERGARMARSDDAPWGEAMNGLLKEQLTVAAIGHQSWALDELQLLGFAYELADRCQIWFSDEFEVDAA